MQREIRDLGSMIEGGKRLEVEHAISIIIACCKSLALADPRGELR